MKKTILFLMTISVYLLNFQQATAQCGVNAGIDQTECAYVDFIRPMGFSVGTAPSAILWSSSGTGTFSPNATSEVVTYFPSPADKASGAIVMYLNVTNSCGVGMDTSRITFQAVPVVHAGLDVVVCSDSVFLNGSIANTPSASWVTSGTGFFINANALSAIYNASTADKANGNVTLRLRAVATGSCASIEDTLLVSFSGASASVNAGSDRVICGNEIHLSASMSVSSNAASWASSGTGTFSPSSKFLYATYLPSASDKATGNVTLTLTSACSPASDQVTFTLPSTAIPTANAGIDQITSNPIMLNGSIVGATGATWTTTGTGVFSPDATTLTAIYTPSSTDIENGIVELKLTTTGNGACASASDYMKAVLGASYTISGKVTAGANDLDRGIVQVFKKYATYLSYIKADIIELGDAGSFEMDSLSVGTYIICVIPINASPYKGSYLPTFSGNGTLWAGAQEYTISASNLSSQNIALVPYVSAIPTWNTGTDTLSGRVLLTNPLLRTAVDVSVPLENVIVYLKDKVGNKVAYTTSDVNGTYYFSHIKAEDYTIGLEYAGGTIVGNDVAVKVDGNPATSESVQLSLNRVSTATGIRSAYTYGSVFVAPNPAHSVIKISLEEKVPVSGTVRITDGMGSVQYTSLFSIEAASSIEVPVNNLSSGSYIVEILTDKTVFKTKFIKY